MGIVKTGLYYLVLSGDDQMKAKSATHNYLVLELHPVNTKKKISMTSANHEADDPILSRLSFAFFFFVFCFVAASSSKFIFCFSDGDSALPVTSLREGS
jgi:hypothetical protein